MAGSVLILTGPPGAGKTTVARLLAKSSPRAAHVESDSFFHFIGSGYIEPWKTEAHEQNVVVMRIVAAAAAGYADAGYFTIVDGIVSPRWFLNQCATRFRLPVTLSRTPSCARRSRSAPPGLQAGKERGWPTPR